jgi:hypothetical protein
MPIALVENALVGGRGGRDAAGRVIELSGHMLSPTLHSAGESVPRSGGRGCQA